MRKSFILFVVITLFFISCKTHIVREKPIPKNIILLIGDGMGYNQVAATKYFHAIDTPVFDKFPLMFWMSTYPASTYSIEDTNSMKYDQQLGYDTYKAWHQKGYLTTGYTGSAPAATAMASGIKSAKKAIGLDMKGNPVFLITERAAELGKSAGVVTTVQFSHATPGGFAAHNVSRDNYDEIARDMILHSKLSVIMGCGHPFYNANSEDAENAYTYKFVGGQNIWEGLLNGDTLFNSYSLSGDSIVQDIDADGIADGWTLITDSIDFVNLKNLVNPPKRVIGIAENITTLQQKRGGECTDKVYEPSVPKEILSMDANAFPFNRNVPRLYQMSLAALNVLNQNNKGFFLMIEGGAIDKAGHDLSYGRMIEETYDFYLAVDSVVAWVQKNSSWEETIVIVTGDHETGYLAGPNYPEDDLLWESDTMINTYPLVDKGKGVMPGGKLMYNNHTNQLIPIYIWGKGDELFLQYATNEDLVWGPYIDNTDLGKAMFDMWRK
ncbi:MAG: alkaline phosphatase [Bacteroidales bacterium]|nr:alkaline phosphatase [Bacteroidales bacterium]